VVVFDQYRHKKGGWAGIDELTVCIVCVSKFGPAKLPASLCFITRPGFQYERH